MDGDELRHFKTPVSSIKQYKYATDSTKTKNRHTVRENEHVVPPHAPVHGYVLRYIPDLYSG